MQPDIASAHPEKTAPNNSSFPDLDEPVKVVLADDDQDDQELFQQALAKTAIPTELTTFDNGRDLMKNLKDPDESNPDIIFMDINMPVKNGKEALAEIKADDDLKDIPTVILSTSHNEKDVEETFQGGANLYVPKPNSFNNFVVLLRKIFSLNWTGDLLKPLRKTFLLSEHHLREK